MRQRPVYFTLVVFALVAAVAFVVAACGGEETPTTTSGGAVTTASTAPASSETTATTAGEVKPIRIGTSLPLTGARSVPGTAAKMGYEVWVEMMNEKGGLLGRPIELIVKDDASDQNIIVADYNALISEDKVDLLLGTFSSLLVLPSSAVAEKNNMVYITPAGASPQIYERGFKKIFMSQQTLAPDAGKVWANWIASLPEDQRPKTAAYPTIDDPFTAPVVEGIEAILSAAGIQTVYKDKYPEGTTDFDSIVNAIVKAKPDLIAHGAVFEDGVSLVRGLLKAGYAPTFLFQTTAPTQGDQYSEGIGAENTEGVFFHMSWAPEAKTPLNDEFIARFKAKFGEQETISEDSADAFAAGQVLAAAVEAVGSLDQDAIADWLHNNEVQTILGVLSWDEAGRPQGEMMIGQWQGGGVEIVLPQDLASTDNIVMKWSPKALQ
jgi:branched-chain amino acid transport system substrate-binding protein